jgi:hypothetical protein
VRGIANQHCATAMPMAYHRIPVTRLGKTFGHLRRKQALCSIGPYLSNLCTPAGFIVTCLRQRGCRQTPEKAQSRRCIARARAHRQHADHPPRMAIALTQLIVPKPVACRHEAPLRAPGIGSIEHNLADLRAQCRSGAIRDHHQIERAVFVALTVVQDTAIVIDAHDLATAVDASVLRPCGIKHFE